MRNAFVAVAMAAGLIGLGGCDDSSGDGSTSGSTSGGTTAAATTGGSSTGSSGGSTTGGTTGGSTTGGSTSGTTGGTTGTGGVLDPRDGQAYPTVVIGSQTWIAKNMNYEISPSGSFCYNNTPSNCDTYGRLYTWAVANQICPAGWHLPSDDEWKTLETHLGMAANQLDIDGEITARGTDQGTALKEGGSSGFEAKLGGYATGPSFYLLGTDGFYWTSTMSGSQIWRRHVNSSTPYLYRFQNPPASFAISVRCLQ